MTGTYTAEAKTSMMVECTTILEFIDDELHAYAPGYVAGDAHQPGGDRVSDEAVGLDWLRTAVAHRLATHKAALSAAEALGWPYSLSDLVHATTAMMVECTTILEIIDQELMAHGPGYVAGDS